MTLNRPLAFLSLLAWSASVLADLSLLVVIEPTSRQDAFSLSAANLEAGLGAALKQQATLTKSDDLSDAMRATRSGGYDVFIAPAQVAASALSHGYELIGSTDKPEQYVLVGKKAMASAAALRGGRIYLPQQDSIYTYMARGMLNSAGLSLRDLRSVAYERYPQAGLVSVNLGASDATVIRLGDWEAWSKDYPGVARVLATSTPVPGGFSVVIKKDLSSDVRAKAAKWFATVSDSSGLRPVTIRPQLSEYKSVAELGTFTPTSLPGVKVVNASEVRQLIASGAVFVDTRTEKEFKAKRVPQAVFAPYVEKSLKDVVFDVKVDDFSALDKVDKSKPTIFACNGAECWKSYKASKFALGRGFTQVYWFRGGLPEWEAARQPVAKD